MASINEVCGSGATVVDVIGAWSDDTDPREVVFIVESVLLSDGRELPISAFREECFIAKAHIQTGGG